MPRHQPRLDLRPLEREVISFRIHRDQTSEVAVKVL